MRTMTDPSFKLQFPVWKFLNQPIFHPKIQLMLNPGQFWQHYQITHLERCWGRAYRPEERFRR